MAEAQNTEGTFKIKKPTEKPTEAPAAVEQVEQTGPASVSEDGTLKLDLSKPVEPNANTEQETADVVADQQTESVQEVEAEVPQQPEPVQTNEPVQEELESEFLQEITDEEVVEQVEELEEQVEQAIVEQSAGVELPENIQKVVNFINETGGSLEDYVKLNVDYGSLDEDQLLKEYYQTSKPHLDGDEVAFLLDENFAFDEDIDDDRDVIKKKIARKEELSKAKTYLDNLKSTYYEEIKGGSKLAPEQKKAVDFFNRYTKENELATQTAEKQTNAFLDKTGKLFNENFKGFDYSVGDKKYRFKVKDAETVKNNQSDINNFIKKFLNEDGVMSDAQGYHKSLFTAMNADSVAQHFYEQGKSDAMKESVSNSKNIKMGARGVHENVKPNNGGWSVRSVDSGSSDSKLKIKSFKHLK
jgi:guanyl-specific ribonuclease Sa